MEKYKKIVIALLVVLSIIVMLQNTEPVDTKLLFFTITMPRTVLLMVTLLLGVSVGLLLAWRFSSKPTKKEAR